MYKTFEGFTKFSIYEGIDNNINIQQNTNLVNSIKNNNLDFSNNYLDISNNITSYYNTQTQLIGDNNKYHYNNIDDVSTLLGYKEPKDIKTAINNDINEIKLYQNTIYITGIIACTTLLIASIMITKK